MFLKLDLYYGGLTCLKSVCSNYVNSVLEAGACKETKLVGFLDSFPVPDPALRTLLKRHL